ncbi:hypothetical protein GN109_06190 [Collimonas pratensis]|uniref:hypothetical protein n=1 Tax=Collimonas pratensis TaxID=279113 RepID=UPI00143CE4FE|nr:hypothetical protein [Collimonas pratensis]NKI69004.1 hypothetical protein [Collimonas pratensis]
MNAVTEKKQANNTVTEAKQTVVETLKAPINELQNAIDQLDAEMKATLKSAVDQLVPGASFNPGLVKEISKIETRKIRLITARLDVLLRKGNPEAQQIVDRLLTIEI